MSTKLARCRQSAYTAQSGRYFYCGLPMWQQDPESFALSHGISLLQAKALQCTAEHLKAR